MRRLWPFALLAVLGLGCGDSTSLDAGACTGLLVRVTWPPVAARWIPSTASRIDVAVLDALSDDQLALVTILRPDDSTKLIGLPPATEVTVVANAYPDSTADTNQVAVASCTVQATVPEGAPEPLELVLASTVSQVEILPSPLGIDIGSLAQLAATGRNAEGAAVLVDPGMWSWSSDAESVAAISELGLVRGVSDGVASVTAAFTPDDPAVAPGPSASVLVAVKPGPPTEPIYGLCFGPYIQAGESPSQPIGERTLAERLVGVAPYASWVRTFGTTGGLEAVPALARAMGLKVAAGAWLDAEPDHAADNAVQVAGLARLVATGSCELAVVGSETLYRGDLTESTLVGYIQSVRRVAPMGTAVTTADTYGAWIAHPGLVDACGVIVANAYPYWEGVSIEGAVAALDCAYQHMVAAAPGKVVRIGETGWPSEGPTVGAAVPSVANAARYFAEATTWARTKGVEVMWFEALDEPWKATSGAPQEAHFGLWATLGALKAGIQATFDGVSTADTWTVPGGPGEPSIGFVRLSALGSMEGVRGQVLHVDPAGYRVAVYAYVPGEGEWNSWWTKPTFAEPLTPIGCGGLWQCAIGDAQVTRVAAYLLPAGVDPPALGPGDPDLPSELGEYPSVVADLQ